MSTSTSLSLRGFFDTLQDLPGDIWNPCIEDHRIHLYRMEMNSIFNPLTAVYFHLTGNYIHRGSFWQPEIGSRCNLPWWEIIEIIYASNACDTSRSYDRFLRDKLLKILGLPGIQAYSVLDDSFLENRNCGVGDMAIIPFPITKTEPSDCFVI